MQISRKQDDNDQWQTYAILIGEAIDEDGKVLEGIHKKVLVGSPGPNDWDADSFESDLQTIATTVKAKYNNVLANYTTP
jgi:hypothetical protein